MKQIGILVENGNQCKPTILSAIAEFIPTGRGVNGGAKVYPKTNPIKCADNIHTHQLKAWFKFYLESNK